MQALRKLRLSNIKEYKSADGLQITADLPSGEQIHVMASSEGWHVAFGEMSPYGAPPAVSEREAAQIIMSA